MEEHTADIRNIKENDHVTLETTEGGTFHDVECRKRERHNADPRTGEIRETQIWSFTVGHKTLVASITDGLKSSPDGPEFPIHKPASLGESGMTTGWGTVGFIKSVQIHG